MTDSPVVASANWSTEPALSIAISSFASEINGESFSHAIYIWDTSDGSVVAGVASSPSWADALQFASGVARLTGLPIFDVDLFTVAAEGRA